MLNLYAKQRCQAAREVLARYRNAVLIVVWALVLTLPAEAILLLFGIPLLLVILIVILGIGAAIQNWRYAEKHVHSILQLPCLECYSDEEEIAFTDILGEWVCGFCAKTHPSFDIMLFWRRTLVDQCKNCNRLQHSVACWRCDEPIIWDENAFRSEPKTSAWHPRHVPLTEEPEAPERRPPRFIEEDFR